MHNYRPKRVDINQSEIVRELRDRGFSVLPIHEVGKGVPDLLVAKDRYTVLVEVKSAKGKVNPLQADFIDKWNGVVVVAKCCEDVVDAFYPVLCSGVA